MALSREKCRLCLDGYLCKARKSADGYYYDCVLASGATMDCPVALLHAENQRLREENERVQREASRMLRECEVKLVYSPVEMYKCGATGRLCSDDEKTCGGWCGGED